MADNNCEFCNIAKNVYYDGFGYALCAPCRRTMERDDGVADAHACYHMRQALLVRDINRAKTQWYIQDTVRRVRECRAEYFAALDVYADGHYYNR